MVKPAPVVLVAAVVTVITPFVTLIGDLMLAVAAKVGTPLAPAVQPVNVPSSCAHIPTAVLVEASSANAAAARVREM